MIYRTVFIILVVSAITALLYLLFLISFNQHVQYSPSLSEKIDFKNFDNTRGTKDGCYIVPNYVHFIRFNKANISFIDAVCILAAFKNQQPERLYIHTNVPSFRGKYWQVLLNTPGFQKVLRIEYLLPPQEIFGQKLNKGWINYHGSDVERLRTLMKYGGIYLDNDSYIVRSLDDFRKYEMALGWMENAGLANQVIIANKNARFLKLWLLTYKNGYDKNQWYYNAGIKPTKEVLEKNPELIHREKFLLANHYITYDLYLEKWNGWRYHYAIHLLYNHQYLLTNVSKEVTYPVEFNETNILKYNVTVKDMVCDVYPINCTNR